jgi:transcriptional regulator with XRE-family HTH domain
MMNTAQPVGGLLRDWRQRRRMSQLDLATDAQISTRHLSFVETGRAQPSRDMVLHLSDRLAVPLRDQNVLLVAAGYAPVFPERDLDDPALAPARKAVDLILTGHEPYPAIAVDRHWDLIAGNGAAQMFMKGADPALLEPPVNVLRLSLHPNGLAPRIANLAEWRDHLFHRLRQQIDASGDPALAELARELAGYKAPASVVPFRQSPSADLGGIVVPIQFVTDDGMLSFFSTTTVFGTPVDITLAELALETFFPADAETADALRGTAKLRR